ncbi:DNA mismatch repair protein MutS [Pseudodesulfovibrio cashew]|uniref:DNA mismatch repair protein MutS n=1 Tax=Pseudodesulfovibrio cashew TaxID=2678688 RepID=A0A6I6JK25_9BACT|nr:Smr/MutS family protein [Pseudodesulfovibrio cashew]QGY41328.1 DNA mismatch repair protein MutS [Pseudodesulfovibrio cashew]
MGKKKRIQNLSQLKDLKLKKDKDDAYTLPYEKKARPDAAETERNEPADEELFMAAMHGVKNLEGGGRQVTPAQQPAATALSVDPEERARNDLQRFLRGEVEFELEYTEEYMYGYVRGLDIKTFQQLKAGALSVEAHLDLHGMTSVQARDSLHFFIRESYMQGHRCVLVVTGRGHNSPGGQSVLRRETEGWLTRDPLKRVVLAFCTAQAKDGGAGAIYVLLRKQKKTQGKITWDKMANWDEMP